MPGIGSHRAPGADTVPTAATTVWEDIEIPAHARGGQVTLHLHDHLAAYTPKRPGAYLRISSDHFGLEAGVDRQLEDAEDTRSRLRWGSFAKVYRENDTSAFKKRKVIKPDGSIPDDQFPQHRIDLVRPPLVPLCVLDRLDARRQHRPSSVR
ncbi:hypothetical protein [Streptomyces lydicus]|uniref:hypothetical protein n=1 Tax=Streptomyces lydicus TaxID=47763 RepID=UPI0037D5F3C9